MNRQPAPTRALTRLNAAMCNTLRRNFQLFRAQVEIGCGITGTRYGAATVMELSWAGQGNNLALPDVLDFRVEEGKALGLKLFHTTKDGVTEVAPRLAEVEAELQGLIEADMETMLGVRFLASEYVIDCVDGGRIDIGTGPVLNPFPLDRSRRGRRAHAHHNPMDPPRSERTGLYRPRVPKRVPRSVPDEEFNEIFAQLPSHRDRVMVAFYISTGARASELLSTWQAGADPGRQLISVVRKGTGEVQELPASTDAFVWLRLYQLEMDDAIPRGRRLPPWWTLRSPSRPLTYHAVHRMFEQANAQAGTSATLHALRHTAAYRMAEDPSLPLTDVQFVLGHAQLTTTQLYLTPRKEVVIRRLLAHHAEQTRQAAARMAPPPAADYRPESLDVLFGTDAR
ncbi:site-specific integrase [Streptomyces coeruleorubidus]|uniref:tyrosine-type recombinase/integrase n=1 Tax=Streptomyces coeruleorubidus TaxID=116188 RepID=UPI0033D34AA7